MSCTNVKTIYSFTTLPTFKCGLFCILNSTYESRVSGKEKILGNLCPATRVSRLKVMTIAQNCHEVSLDIVFAF